MEDNKADLRRFWRIINKNVGMGKSKSSAGCTKVRAESDKILQGGEVGDFLSSYYAQNGTKLAEKFVTKWHPNNFESLHVQRGLIFDFIPMNIVKKLIKE